jgi:hypothetical protein
MKNRRCRMHGGLSTGPRTAEGLARSRRARWKHGFCSMEIRVLRGAAAHTARNLAALVRVSRGIAQRRTTRSSLGMGFIERNRRGAGASSGVVGALSLGMRSIEQIHVSAGSSSGAASRPRE